MVLAMASVWRRFQTGRWWWRLPAKGLIVAVTVFLVSFPNPVLFGRHVQRWRHPDQLIDPDAPELAAMRAELEPKLAEVAHGQPALKVVERYVYQKVPYAHDWETWGAADFIPTVGEALAMGREDCDGRAVVSASLLRSLGYNARLVTDFTHVWVKTDRGEAMHPGPMKKAVESRDDGLAIDWGQLANLPRSLSYGCAVFPLGRELIVLVVIVLMSIRPGMSGGRWFAATAMLVGGLLGVRYAARNPWEPVLWGQWLGWGMMLVGLVMMAMRAKPQPSHSFVQNESMVEQDA